MPATFDISPSSKWVRGEKQPLQWIAQNANGTPKDTGGLTLEYRVQTIDKLTTITVADGDIGRANNQGTNDQLNWDVTIPVTAPVGTYRHVLWDTVNDVAFFEGEVTILDVVPKS